MPPCRRAPHRLTDVGHVGFGGITKNVKAQKTSQREPKFFLGRFDIKEKSFQCYSREAVAVYFDITR